MMNKIAKWTFIGLVLAAAALPVTAQPITVAPGNDGWKTPAGSSTVDLAVFPISAVFGPGAVVSPTVVALGGSPLIGALGTIDTLLERPGGSVTYVTFPETHTFPVVIKGLRLKGQTTVDGTLYDLVVSLSETPSGAGTITATRLTPDGGKFTSSFPVLPKLTFTEVGNPANKVIIDCGSVPGCPTPLTLGASDVCWEVAFGPNNFDPATKGITPIPAGIAIDGTFNGVNDYTTVGRKRAGTVGLEFHVGYTPVPPWNPCGTVSHDHAVYSLKHKTTTANDCPPTRGPANPTTDPTTPDHPSDVPTELPSGTSTNRAGVVATPAPALACPAVAAGTTKVPVGDN